MSTTAATAGEQVSGKVTDHYKWVTQSSPITETICNTEQIPVYQDVQVQGGNNAAGGALLGMIIGGVAGKTITGKDNGAAAGAVMGGIIGADQGSRNSQTRIERRVVGYEEKRVCNNVTRYVDKQQKVYDYSTIEWKQDGKSYSAIFYK